MFVLNWRQPSHVNPTDVSIVGINSDSVDLISISSSVSNWSCYFSVYLRHWNCEPLTFGHQSNLPQPHCLSLHNQPMISALCIFLIPPPQASPISRIILRSDPPKSRVVHRSRSDERPRTPLAIDHARRNLKVPKPPRSRKVYDQKTPGYPGSGREKLSRTRERSPRQGSPIIVMAYGYILPKWIYKSQLLYRRS